MDTPASVVGNFLLCALLAGSVGAAGMAFVLWVFTKSKLTNVPLVLVVGSLVTRSYEKAPLVGGWIHAAFGIFFAEIYTWILLLASKPGLGANMTFGAVIGMLHGLIMALILMATIPEVHPLEEFRQRGFAVAVAYWTGHIVYGLLVGLVVGISGIIPPPPH